MKNSQRGFIAQVLLVVVALLTIGSGAYFVMQKNAPAQTASENTLNNTQTLPTPNNQVQQKKTATSDTISQTTPTQITFPTAEDVLRAGNINNGIYS